MVFKLWGSERTFFLIKCGSSFLNQLRITSLWVKSHWHGAEFHPQQGSCWSPSHISWHPRTLERAVLLFSWGHSFIPLIFVTQLTVSSWGSGSWERAEKTQRPCSPGADTLASLTNQSCSTPAHCSFCWDVLPLPLSAQVPLIIQTTQASTFTTLPDSRIPVWSLLHMPPRRTSWYRNDPSPTWIPLKVYRCQSPGTEPGQSRTP